MSIVLVVTTANGVKINYYFEDSKRAVFGHCAMRKRGETSEIYENGVLIDAPSFYGKNGIDYVATLNSQKGY